MKNYIEFGPYKGRAYGQTPITFQLFCIKNQNLISDIDFKNWLLNKAPYIEAQCRKFSKHYLESQFKMFSTFIKGEKNGNKSSTFESSSKTSIAEKIRGRLKSN